MKKLKRIICKLAGHKWRPLTAKEIDTHLSTGVALFVCCSRCGYNGDGPKGHNDLKKGRQNER